MLEVSSCKGTGQTYCQIRGSGRAPPPKHAATAARYRAALAAPRCAARNAWRIDADLSAQTERAGTA
eukprot:2597780-Pyramimonas_sp.AAC.1